MFALYLSYLFLTYKPAAGELFDFHYEPSIFNTEIKENIHNKVNLLLSWMKKQYTFRPSIRVNLVSNLVDKLR